MKTVKLLAAVGAAALFGFLLADCYTVEDKESEVAVNAV